MYLALGANIYPESPQSESITAVQDCQPEFEKIRLLISVSSND
jgi:hypothetical protein